MRFACHYARQQTGQTGTKQQKQQKQPFLCFFPPRGVKKLPLEIGTWEGRGLSELKYPITRFRSHLGQPQALNRCVFFPKIKIQKKGHVSVVLTPG